jgi:hypothetical protein
LWTHRTGRRFWTGGAAAEWTRRNSTNGFTVLSQTGLGNREAIVPGRKEQTTRRRETMAEPIGDGSIFFRLDLLKKRLVQFTDATTAARLLREHGRDIRYNAAWKKWAVWENTHWQMDDGTLIYKKA